MSPVGGAALDVAPALPLREEATGCPRASKLVELHLGFLAPELLSRLLDGARVLVLFMLRVDQLVVLAVVVVPELLALGFVADTKLHTFVVGNDTWQVDEK